MGFCLRNSIFSVVMFCTILFSLPVKEIYGEKADLGIKFNVLSPQYEFRENLDRNGYGFSLEGFYKPFTLPVKFGLHLGFSQYGKDERRESFNPDIPEVKVEVETSNNVIFVFPVVRLQKNIGRFSPYCDGLFGIQYLYTESVVNNIGYGTEQPIATTKNFDDAVFSYGAGIGCMIVLYTFDKAVFKKTDNARLMLDFNVRYIKGGEAEYLKKGSIKRENGNLIYDVYTSEIDMLYFQFGIVVSF